MSSMLTLLNATQLVLYIALLALIGQAALHLLAGRARDTNPFYRVLQWLSKPFTSAVRRITPRRISDTQVPWVTFCLLAALYLWVTLERIDLCVSSHWVGRSGCA